VGPSLTLNLPSTGHEFHVVEGEARCFAVEAPAAWMSDLANVTGVSPRPVLDSGEPGSLSFTLGLYDELLRPDDLSSTVVEEQLVAALEHLLGPDVPSRGHPPAWLRRSREILEDASPGAPGLSELAELVGVHRVHLAQSFRRFYGSSVGEYARMLRLRRAQREIANSERPLGEIALRAGFYDQSHLNRRFRRAMGMTPGRFRRLARRA
jgi:AraC family transcriptional regulator